MTRAVLPSPLSPDLLATAIAMAAIAGLAVMERSWVLAVAVLLVPVLRRLATRVRLAVFATTLLLAAVALRAVHGTTLYHHLVRGQRTLALLAGTHPAIRTDTCAAYTFRPDHPAPPGARRNERGFAEYRVDGGDALSLLVVGDSLFHEDAAMWLAEAMRATDTGGGVLNTAMRGYGWRDEACVASQAMEDARPDLAIVGLCINDFPMGAIDGAARRYTITPLLGQDWRSGERLPLLMDSTHPFVEAHGDALKATYGDTIRWDVTDPQAYASLFDGNDRALYAELHALADVFDQAEVPVVFVLFPTLYAHTPDPTDLILDHTRDTLLERGALVVDPRGRFRAQPADRLWAHPDAYDLIHIRRPGIEAALALALEAAGRVHPQLARPALIQRLEAEANARW